MSSFQSGFQSAMVILVSLIGAYFVLCYCTIARNENRSPTGFGIAAAFGSLVGMLAYFPWMDLLCRWFYFAVYLQPTAIVSKSPLQVMVGGISLAIIVTCLIGGRIDKTPGRRKIVEPIYVIPLLQLCGLLAVGLLGAFVYCVTYIYARVG